MSTRRPTPKNLWSLLAPIPESKLGGVLLGGIEYFTSNTVSIKGEASYHLISNADGFAGRGPRNPDGFKLTIGLKKYF